MRRGIFSDLLDRSILFELTQMDENTRHTCAVEVF